MLPSREQAEQRRVLVGLGHAAQFGCGADDLVAALLGLHLECLALVLAAGRGLGERLGAAAQRDVRAGGQQLLGDRARAAVLERLGRRSPWRSPSGP